MAKIFIIVISIVIQCLVASCSNTVFQRESIPTNSSQDSYLDSDGCFVIREGKYLFYNEYKHKSTNLYRYNLEDGKTEYVDNITNDNTNFFGVVKMFLIGNRLYYGKSTSDNNISEIYSVDIETLSIRFEGDIPMRLDAFNGEFVEDEFRIFQYGNIIYILAKNNLYELQNNSTNIVCTGISSIYLQGSNMYYAPIENNSNDLSIMCYNTETQKQMKILDYDAIKNYSMTATASGETAFVQNIIVDEDALYFLNAKDPVPISRFNFNESTSIESLTDVSYTRMFRKYGNLLYYINFQHRLCRVGCDGNDQEIIISDQYVYSYSVYDDKIYYYKVTDNRGYPSELAEYDISTKQYRTLITFD